jgi:hypothetical protein
LQKDHQLGLKLSAIKDRLQKVGVKWAIFAGAAASCYGSRRQVTDIDILVRAADFEKAKAALKNLNTEGFDIAPDGEINTSAGVYRFLMDNEMIERTRWMQLLGVKVPVTPVEDNIIFKAILQRGEEEGKHDVEDIRFMINYEKIDLGYLRSRIRKSHAEKRVNPLLKSMIPDI